MRGDLRGQFQFPGDITATSLRPDIMMRSVVSKTVLLELERTVPWEEEGLEAAHEGETDTGFCPGC